ncbi:MAG: flagellar biosynthetic protein FliR [Opitutales bacterium]|nr:flagellar biosynthetic protein FliR [Opitutales bacterium]
MSFELENIYALMLCFVRTGALFMAVPVFGGSSIPMQVRILLAMLVSVMMLPMAQSVDLTSATVPVLATAMLFEFFIGMLMGLAIQAVLSCIHFASETITNEIGLLRMENFNPGSDTGSGGGLSTMLYYFSLMIFLALGLHHEVIAALARSFQALPAGSLNTSGLSFSALMHVTLQLFIMGLLISAPFIAINFIVNTTFSLLGKVAPKMNVFAVSFSVRILVGFTALSFTAGLLAHYIGAEFTQVPGRMLDIVLGR